MPSNRVTINEQETFEIPDSQMDEIRHMLVRKNSPPSMVLCSDSVVTFLSKLVDNVRARSHSKAIRDYMKSLAGSTQVLDMCTVIFGMPRRSGNTTLAVELLKRHSDSILMVRDHIAEKMVKEMVTDQSVANRVRSSACTGELLERSVKLLITDLYDHRTSDSVSKFAIEMAQDPEFVWLRLGQ